MQLFQIALYTVSDHNLIRQSGPLLGYEQSWVKIPVSRLLAMPMDRRQLYSEI